MINFKRITALLAAGIVALGTVCSVFAEPTDTDDTGSDAEVTIDDGTSEEGTYTESVYMEDPSLSAPDTSLAEAALLMDLNTGRLIYGKNIDEVLYPASTTKMMTAIIALESGRMDDTATATYDALKSITLEDSHMGILIGEELTMTDLVYGMMVYSANDAANVIAIHIGGTMDAFVNMMNDKAQELGMTSTHFMNPCGVHDDNHYTTARDLATLARYCMQNETFREIVKTPTYHIDPTNKYEKDRDLPSTNLFLGTSRSAYYVYKPCTGIKTGTTEMAGHCLVASASYNNMDILTVVMKCADENYEDKAYSYITTQNLFDFGFNNYKSGTLASPGNIIADAKVAEAKGGKRVTLTVDTDVNALIPTSSDDISSEVQTVVTTNEDITAPIAKGDVLGTVVFRYRDSDIGSANLIASNDVEQNVVLHYIHSAFSIITNPLFFIPAILIVIIGMFAAGRARRAKRKRRIQQLKQRRNAENGIHDRQVRNNELSRSRSKGATSRYSGERRK